VSPRSTAFFASRPAPSISEGFDVFVQLVIAAITTEPSAQFELVAVVLHLTCFARFGERFLERDFGVAQRHAVLRALGPGHRRHDGCADRVPACRKIGSGVSSVRKIPCSFE
jgi:hypothetical protein